MQGPPTYNSATLTVKQMQWVTIANYGSLLAWLGALPAIIVLEPPEPIHTIMVVVVLPFALWLSLFTAWMLFNAIRSSTSIGLLCFYVVIFLMLGPIAAWFHYYTSVRPYCSWLQKSRGNPNAA